MGIKTIYLLKGFGYGNSKKSAFDDALRRIGLENANIIEISSIIPEGVEEVKEIEKYELKKYGNKVYAVVSYRIEEKKAVAGLGIVYDKEKKRGVILEVNGLDEKEVREKLKLGIEEMLSYRDLKGDVKYLIQLAENNSSKKYVCALVIAVYKEEDW